MKTANEIANEVRPQSNYRDNTMSKVQITILEALGICKVEGHAHAKMIFEALGIVVNAKRTGRSYVPEVTILPRQDSIETGGWNPGDEDGWSYTEKIERPEIDFSAIADYIVS